MKFETPPELESMTEVKPLEGWERVLLGVVDAYKRGECPHHRGESLPHARGGNSRSAFCSKECIDDFEHEYRVEHNSSENVIRDHSSMYAEASLETYREPQHRLLEDLRLRRDAQNVTTNLGKNES